MGLSQRCLTTVKESPAFEGQANIPEKRDRRQRCIIHEASHGSAFTARLYKVNGNILHVCVPEFLVEMPRGQIFLFK